MGQSDEDTMSAASFKQRVYLHDLRRELGWPIIGIHTMSAEDMSACIDKCKKEMARRKWSVPPEETYD